MPAYVEVRVDEDGNTWLNHYAPPRLPSPVWTVLSREGRFLGTVRMAERLRVLHIGIEAILGVWNDELDVQYVRLHRIEK
jgi:hypothetical protein